MPSDPQHLLPAGNENKTTHPTLIWIAVLILILLAVAAWMIEANLQQVRESDADTTATTTPSTLENSGGVVSVQDQRAGDTVLVDSVTVPAPGVWVAVAEIRENDLGNILGAARALASSTDITVSLLRATTPGQTYAVVLYRDNGDGVFDPHSDSVYVDFASGQRVVALFQTNL